MVDRDFHTVDYILFALSLGLSLGIGVWAAFTGGKQSTTGEFLMGNRELNPLAVGMSIFMSFISAILVLGNVAEVYLYGIQWWLQLWGDLLAYAYICIICVPFFYKMKLTSSFEYLERRFQPRGKMVRYSGDIFQTLFLVLYMGTSLFAPAIALNGAIGFPVWATILISGVVATIYTAMGGMKAVVWTDLVQGFIYMAGVVIILIIGTNKAGGIENVWNTSKEYNRLDLFNFDLNPATRLTFWSLVIGTFVSSLQTVGTSQTSVQRYCAVNSINKARFTILMLVPSIFIMITLTCAMGLVIFAYYANEGCDPMRTGDVDNPNSILPVFIIDVIDYPGLGGLFLAVLFSGALSSLSSSISSLAAVTWTDFLEDRYSHIPESRKALITKLLSILFGIAGIGAAFFISNLEGPIAQASLGLVSGVAGPLLGIFLLGMLVPWANAIVRYHNLIIRCFGSGSFYIAMGFYDTSPYVVYPDTEVSNCPEIYDIHPTDIVEIPTADPEVFSLYKISFMWYSAIGCGTTMVLGTILSFITGPTDPRSIDPELIVPMFDKLFCCLPSSWRKKLWCGVQHDQSQQAEVTQVKVRKENEESQNTKDGKFDDVTIFSEVDEADNGVKHRSKSLDNAGYVEHEEDSYF